MELADTLEEVKTLCATCDSKAVFNLRLVGDKAVLDGAQVAIGAEEAYRPVCKRCYERAIGTTE